MKKVQNILFNLIVYISAVLYLIALLCMVIGVKEEVFSAGKNFLCIVIFSLLMGCVFWMKKKEKMLFGGRIRHINGLEYIISFGIFLLEIFVCYNAYFYTGWDCAIVQSASENVSKGWGLSGFSDYFSHSTNNLFIVYVYGGIRKFARLFGIVEKDEGVFVLIMVQCLINTLTGLAIYKFLEKETGTKKGAWAGYFAYFILLGTSPWILITYSDASALLFPILIIFIWYLQYERKNIVLQLVCFGLIGVLAGVGYNMKPQIVICYIALVLLELVGFIAQRRYSTLLKLFLSIIVLVGTLLFLKQKIYYLDSTLEKNVSLTPYHFVMMGLSTTSDGTFCREDVAFSTGFSSSEEQIAANKKEIVNRVRTMGVGGLGIHLGRKLVTIYGDGSFGWPNRNERTSYFYVGFRTKQLFPRISSIIGDILWEDCVLNSIFRWIKQIVYIGILLIIGIYPFVCKSNRTAVTSLLYLSLMGVYMFEMLFEASSRHVYVYVPLMIVLATLNIKDINRLK